MTKKDIRDIIPIDVNSDFDTQQLTGIKEAIQQLSNDEKITDKNQDLKVVKPTTKFYQVREVMSFNYTNILHFRFEKIRTKILTYIYKNNKAKIQNLKILLNHIDSLLKVQKDERKLITLIRDLPITTDEEKIREELAYLFAIINFNYNRVDQLQKAKKLCRQNKLATDELTINTHEKDVNYILEKVKKR